MFFDIDFTVKHSSMWSQKNRDHNENYKQDLVKFNTDEPNNMKKIYGNEYN